MAGMKALRIDMRSIVVFALLLGVLIASSASFAGDKILPPNADSYGKSLGQWLYGYWAWYLGHGGLYEPYQPGPAPIV
jgi:hypothetical protein